MTPCKIEQTVPSHRLCLTCGAHWYVEHEAQKAPCPFPLHARNVLDKIVAEAEERSRAAGRAEVVAELRAASERWGKLLTTAWARKSAEIRMVALAEIADELEAGGKAPAERQDGGERA